MKNSIQCHWTYPTDIRVGAGCLNQLPELVSKVGMKAPLIVTDAGLLDHEMIQRAQALLPSAALFSDVQGNPVDANLDAGIKAFLDGNHDGVIAIGGGSAMDVGKLVALMARQIIPVWDLEDIGDWWARADANVIAPIIAVPTTAGTGSEVGRAAVLTNQKADEKKIIFHPKMLPEFVLGDPELAMALPAHLTAATGMDALTHSFETFCIDSFHPMADGIALESMRLTKDFLPRATKDGTDIEARLMMFSASMMGGVAFQKGLGAVHSIAHPLGAVYGLHHGLANAILLPYVISFNRPAIEKKVSRVVRMLEIGTSFDDFLDWVLAFREELGIPHTLAQVGITDERADEIAIKALADPSTAFNPREITAKDLKAIFLDALSGSLPR